MQSDRAAALASYAKQAADEDLENKARMIRNRAIRRMGQVLEQIEPKKNQHDANTGGGISRTEAATQAGISKRQKDTALRVAAIPEDDFEAATNSDQQPTLTESTSRGTKKRIVIDHTGGRDPKVFNRRTNPPLRKSR